MAARGWTTLMASAVKTAIAAVYPGRVFQLSESPQPLNYPRSFSGLGSIICFNISDAKADPDQGGMTISIPTFVTVGCYAAAVSDDPMVIDRASIAVRDVTEQVCPLLLAETVFSTLDFVLRPFLLKEPPGPIRPAFPGKTPSLDRHGVVFQSFTLETEIVQSLQQYREGPPEIA